MFQFNSKVRAHQSYRPNWVTIGLDQCGITYYSAISYFGVEENRIAYAATECISSHINKTILYTTLTPHLLSHYKNNAPLLHEPVPGPEPRRVPSNLRNPHSQRRLWPPSLRPNPPPFSAYSIRLERLLRRNPHPNPSPRRPPRARDLSHCGH